MHVELEMLRPQKRAYVYHTDWDGNDKPTDENGKVENGVNK